MIPDYTDEWPPGEARYLASEDFGLIHVFHY